MGGYEIRTGLVQDLVVYDIEILRILTDVSKKTFGVFCKTILWHIKQGEPILVLSRTINKLRSVG